MTDSSLRDRRLKVKPTRKGRTLSAHPQAPFTITEAELFSQLPQAIGPPLFLDRFTPEEMEERLLTCGFLPALIGKGVERPRLEFQRVDPDEHRLLIFHDADGAKFVELRLTFEKLEVPPLRAILASPSYFDMLAINWALLQNPRAEFTSERPPMPGQKYPGLGLGRKCQGFLMKLAAELRRDGLINHPQYFHNALFYRDEYFFVDPVRQGQLLAMIRDLAKHPVAVASSAVSDGKLADARTQAMVEWKPGAMVCPLRKRLRRYFESRPYREAVQRSAASHVYDLIE